MRKHLFNILWIIVATPFYVLIGACCLYSMLILQSFKPVEDVEPYNWVDALDTWLFNLKNKWL